MAAVDRREFLKLLGPLSSALARALALLVPLLLLAASPTARAQTRPHSKSGPEAAAEVLAELGPVEQPALRALKAEITDECRKPTASE